MRWATFHVLVSVSWLASTVSHVGETHQQRKYDLQRAEAFKTQLSEDLITALDADNTGDVNELEFVVGMIIALGAEVCGEKLDFKTHVQPLIDRFHNLDEDGSGSLTREDLTFVVQQAQKSQRSQKSQRDAERKTRALAKSHSVAQFMRGRSDEADGRAAKPENADGENVSA